MPCQLAATCMHRHTYRIPAGVDFHSVVSSTCLMLPVFQLSPFSGLDYFMLFRNCELVVPISRLYTPQLLRCSPRYPRSASIRISVDAYNIFSALLDYAYFGPHTSPPKKTRIQSSLTSTTCILRCSRCWLRLKALAKNSAPMASRMG